MSFEKKSIIGQHQSTVGLFRERERERERERGEESAKLLFEDFFWVEC